MGGLRPRVLPLRPSPASGRGTGAHRAWFVRPNYQPSRLPELAGQRDLQRRNRPHSSAISRALVLLQDPTAQCQSRPPAQGGREPGPGEGAVGAGQSPAGGGLTPPGPFPLRFPRHYRRAWRSSSAFPPQPLKERGGGWPRTTARGPGSGSNSPSHQLPKPSRFICEATLTALAPEGLPLSPGA